VSRPRSRRRREGEDASRQWLEAQSDDHGLLKMRDVSPTGAALRAEITFLCRHDGKLLERVGLYADSTGVLQPPRLATVSSEPIFLAHMDPAQPPHPRQTMRMSPAGMKLAPTCPVPGCRNAPQITWERLGAMLRQVAEAADRGDLPRRVERRL
jgi:hypothetical protein